MSLDAICWAREQQTGDAISKFLLITLANEADEEHRVYPDLKFLSLMMEAPLDALKFGMEGLITLGLIKATDQQRGGCPVYQLIDVPGREDEVCQ